MNLLLARKRNEAVFPAGAAARLGRAALAAMIVAGGAVFCAQAEEVDLKALKTLNVPKKSNKTAYVGVYGGTTQSQSADITIRQTSTLMTSDAFPYNLQPSDNGAVVGIEVGQRWKLKKWPVDVGVEFEGMFISTELNGSVEGLPAPVSPAGPPPTPIPPPAEPPPPTPYDLLPNNGITTFKSDMNMAVFLLNGEIGLNLRRYRPYIGRILSSIRPYAGAGFGGSQIWFRNQEFTVKSNNPADIPDSTFLSSDAFVFAFQYYGGAEINVNDKLSGFIDYRHFEVDSFDEQVSGYENGIWTGGVRFLYDKENDK